MFPCSIIRRKNLRHNGTPATNIRSLHNAELSPVRRSYNSGRSRIEFYSHHFSRTTKCYKRCICYSFHKDADTTPKRLASAPSVDGLHKRRIDRTFANISVPSCRRCKWFSAVDLHLQVNWRRVSRLGARSRGMDI